MYVCVYTFSEHTLLLASNFSCVLLLHSYNKSSVSCRVLIDFSNFSCGIKLRTVYLGKSTILKSGLTLKDIFGDDSSATVRGRRGAEGVVRAAMLRLRQAGAY